MLVVVSAPSGGGKTTLCHQILTARPDMARAITCTTREPRGDEKDGEDYYFLDAGSFLKRVQAGNFLEHATVYGQSYGTLKSEVVGKLRTGKDVLLNVDVQGVESFCKAAQASPLLAKRMGTVFINVPIPELRVRLTGRGESETEIAAAIERFLVLDAGGREARRQRARERTWAPRLSSPP